MPTEHNSILYSGLILLLEVVISCYCVTSTLLINQGKQLVTEPFHAFLLVQCSSCWSAVGIFWHLFYLWKQGYQRCVLKMT
ncbi:hypothetical protein LDENG_00265350 [Lucifuga dentata]|nr:hypothetical protein LDENG_00265350 [Lucifuga dentata]